MWLPHRINMPFLNKIQSIPLKTCYWSNSTPNSKQVGSGLEWPCPSDPPFPPHTDLRTPWNPIPLRLTCSNMHTYRDPRCSSMFESVISGNFFFTLCRVFDFVCNCTHKKWMDKNIHKQKITGTQKLKNTPRNKMSFCSKLFWLFSSFSLVLSFINIHHFSLKKISV